MGKRQIKNRYEHLEGGVTRMYLSNRPGVFTLIDTEDLEKIKNTNWWLANDGTVMARWNGIVTRLHRVVMGVADVEDAIVRHVNGNKLDNRKSNLQLEYKFSKNKYEHLGNGTTKIYLSNRPDVFTVIDTEDYERIKETSWLLSSTGYVEGWWQGRRTRLHRVIMNVENERVIIDHINRNTLDNRKENLRIVDKSLNVVNKRMHRNNTSGFRGVCWVEQFQKFSAQARVNGKNIHLGLYESPQEAYMAYLIFMVYYWGFDSLPDYLQKDAIKFGVVKSM